STNTRNRIHSLQLPLHPSAKDGWSDETGGGSKLDAGHPARGVNIPRRNTKLVPEGISDEMKGANTIRLILQNLSVLTQHIAELRGLYGSGHGRDGRHRGLEPRHARLAVGAAVAFIDFVTETYHERHIEKEPADA
ncbi:abortive infection family protein, partial [Rhizobium sp. RAF36]|uniref:abortive infection family protein n=1 Tax=Rhizobium sp. RAF36 TaxID=3233055 RepID=UPI003F97B46C